MTSRMHFSRLKHIVITDTYKIYDERQKKNKKWKLFLYLEQELHHLSVDESLDRLPVDVSDEVTSP